MWFDWVCGGALPRCARVCALARMCSKCESRVRVLVRGFGASVQAEAASARTAAEAAEKRAEVRWRMVGGAVQLCAGVLDGHHPTLCMACRRVAWCLCVFVVQEQGKRAAEAEATQKRLEVCVGWWPMQCVAIDSSL